MVACTYIWFGKSEMKYFDVFSDYNSVAEQHLCPACIKSSKISRFTYSDDAGPAYEKLMYFYVIVVRPAMLSVLFSTDAAEAEAMAYKNDRHNSEIAHSVPEQ